MTFSNVGNDFLKYQLKSKIKKLKKGMVVYRMYHKESENAGHSWKDNHKTHICQKACKQNIKKSYKYKNKTDNQIDKSTNHLSTIWRRIYKCTRLQIHALFAQLHSSLQQYKLNPQWDNSIAIPEWLILKKLLVYNWHVISFNQYVPIPPLQPLVTSIILYFF